MSQDERSITQDFLRELMREQYKRVLEEKVDKKIEPTKSELEEVEEVVEVQKDQIINERDITKDFLKQILSE